MTPTVRYPTNEITPHGVYHMLKGDIPHFAYRSHDDSAVFNLMGPLAIFDPTTPESIRLKGIKGLIPPWKAIEQKGATQDGSTFVTALYDPNEIDLIVEAVGRNPLYCRQVLRDWVASWDAIKPGELSFFTPELGRWWTEVRWSKNPVDKIDGGSFRRQEFTWTAKIYDAFWRSYDDVAEFRRPHSSAEDTFDYTTTSELGSGWTVVYSGTGTGTIHADGSQVVSSLLNGRTVVCRRAGFTTTGNNQGIEIDLGRFPSWFFPTNGYVDFWARMANTGTAGDSGVRLRLGHSKFRLSYFAAGVETVLREVSTIIPILGAEKYTFIAGFDGNDRLFKVLRNGALLMYFIETGTGSPLGSSNRSVGFGLHADGINVPPTILGWRAGDNTTGDYTGFIPRVNNGDQPMWDRYTLFGPGTFSISDGPNSANMVQYGPLFSGQTVQLRTDPRVRGVVDMTSTPPSPQHLDLFQEAIKDIISFATAGNVPPLFQAIESLFGIAPPQGNMYSLLHGRFSDAAAIPAKPAGAAAPIYHVKATISGGNADSQIIAAGTPRRRWPY